MGHRALPVGILAGYPRAFGDRLTRDGPLFPAATRAAMEEFILDMKVVEAARNVEHVALN